MQPQIEVGCTWGLSCSRYFASPRSCFLNTASWNSWNLWAVVTFPSHIMLAQCCFTYSHHAGALFALRWEQDRPQRWGACGEWLRLAQNVKRYDSDNAITQLVSHIKLVAWTFVIICALSKLAQHQLKADTATTCNLSKQTTKIELSRSSWTETVEQHPCCMLIWNTV